MADDDIDYSAYAGRVAFPRNPQDLLSTTTCPACFAVLTSTVCSACQLDLNHPAAAELHEASLATAGTFDKRLAIIGRMRYETERAANLRWTAGQEAAGEQAAAQQAAARVPAVIPAPAVVPEVSTLREPQGGPGSTRENESTREVGGAPVQRRSSVQVTLLVVGVSLLSIAAIFFLVYAFINFGIVWRSVIIGAITVAAFVTASLLRRRNLRATAEGISAFAVVLIYLDAYAIRANNLFDAAGADGTVYWGMTLVVTAIAFIGWHRMSALRIPNIVGFATFAPGVGVLVAGATQHVDGGTQSFLVFSVIAAAGLIHRLATRPGQPATAERAIVLGTTVFALVISLLLVSGAYRDSDWTPTIAAVALAIVAILHVGLLLHADAAKIDRVFSTILSGFAGVAAASAVAASASRIDDPHFLLVAPAIAAVTVTLALEAVTRRVGVGRLRTNGTVASWSAAAIAALTLLPPLSIAAWSTIVTAGHGLLRPWRLGVTDAVSVLQDATGWAILALLIVGAIAALAWAASGLLRARGHLLLWWAAVIAIVAAPRLETQWLVFAGWLVIAGASLVALLVLRRKAVVGTTAIGRYRAILVAAMSIAGFFGYLLGWATTSTWWIGTIVVLAILLTARLLVASTTAKAILFGFATALLLGSIPATARHLALESHPFEPVSAINQASLLALVAAVLLAISAVPLGRFVSTADRRTVFWLSAAASVISLSGAKWALSLLSPGARSELLLPEFATSLVSAALLFVALVLWIGLGANQAMRPERIAASIAVAPTLYLLVTAFARVLGLPSFVDSVAPITAALLAAVGALVISTLRSSTLRLSTTPRWARELSVALVAVPAVFASISTDDGLTWLVLLLAAVTVLFLAIDSDGLFSSRSTRRHFGWLALALATAGLWWRLIGDRVTDLEPYVVPLAITLILIAVFMSISGLRRTPPSESRAAPLVVLAGLLVTVLPLGVNAATGSMPNAVWLFVISLLLLVGGSAITPQPVAQRYLDACALAGAIGVIVIAVGRVAFLPFASIERDGWLAAAFAALLIAAFLQAREPGDGSERVRTIASQALGLVAMTAVLALEAVALRTEPAGAIRALAIVLLFAAIHAAAFIVNRAPLTRTLAWVAGLYSAIAAVVGISVDAIHPVEVATIPIAVALLVTGTMQLATVPTARSWRWLGGGTALLLLPSLFATIDDRPLWRLVGLGVVGTAVIVIGVVRRLQAPFVIGVVVVLIHGIATFLPQLRAAYEFFPWWLWLGVGGVLLIVLAARYEQRIRNLKSVAMKFAALR